jgi:hypothetical protein
MGLISPKDIKNQAHRKLIEYYGTRRANTPLKTFFHQKVPIDLEFDYEAAKPKYNLSKIFLDELIYRYYFDSNFTCLIYGARSDYKSTTALRLKLWLEEIGGIKTDYNDIVDSDKELLRRVPRDKAPQKFRTYIKDEWDTVRSGLGNATMSDVVKNMINRARYDRWNLIICTPTFKYYPCDYFLKAYEYTRYGNRDIMCLLYDETVSLRGHVIFPMPTDKEIKEYEIRKKTFMTHSRKLSFNVDEELVNIAEESMKDPQILKMLSGKMGKTMRVILSDYIFFKYPELQSKSMKENVMLKMIWMYQNHTNRIPRPDK